MKRNVLRVLFVFSVFALGYIAGGISNDPGTAEAGYTCSQYIEARCINEGEEARVICTFHQPMILTRTGNKIDKTEYSIFFKTQ